MFYMASYNIDMFRKFVLSPQFQSRFDLPYDVRKRIEDDDVELMRFAMQWLKFCLFGEGTIDIRDEALKDNLERIDVRR